METVYSLHTNDIIHKDIKPANIIIQSEKVWLVDFGLAKNSKDETILPGAVSLYFSSPEQYNGLLPADKRNDIYSLGATFYYLLTGENPIDAFDRYKENVINQDNDPLPAIRKIDSDIPELIAEIVHKAMAVYQNERFATAFEMLESLREAKIKLNDANKTIVITSNDETDTLLIGVDISYYEAGKKDALRDIESGRLVIKENGFGYRNPNHYDAISLLYQRMLKESCEIEFETFGFVCIEDTRKVDYVNGYNKIAKEHIESKFGIWFFERIRQHAAQKIFELEKKSIPVIDRISGIREHIYLGKYKSEGNTINVIKENNKFKVYIVDGKGIVGEKSEILPQTEHLFINTRNLSEIKFENRTLLGRWKTLKVINGEEVESISIRKDEKWENILCLLSASIVTIIRLSSIH